MLGDIRSIVIKMKHIEMIFIVWIAIGFTYQGLAQQNHNMKQKNSITGDIHFAIGGQKCFRESMDISVTSSEKKLLQVVDKKGIAQIRITGQNLGGVTRMDCSEIKTWKSIPNYMATRAYKISEEAFVIFKEVEDSELVLVTFMGNDDAIIQDLREDLKLNILENSEAEKLELFENESKINERIGLILDVNILNFTPKYPYQCFFIDNSNEDTSKTEATKRAFFLENRRYDLLLIINVE